MRRTVEASPALLLVFPEEWLEPRRIEWDTLGRAASAAGFDVVVTHWETLELSDDMLRVASAHRFPPGGAEVERVTGVAIAPAVVMTTWGVMRPYRALYRELVGTFGCFHSEVALMAHLDGKIELERCLRAYEQRTGRSVPRPATALSDELGGGLRVLSGEQVIVKPSRSGKCRGIEIVPQAALDSLSQEVLDGDRSPFVAQDLVDDVFLYEGRRWDLRVNVLLTSLDPLRYRMPLEGVAKPAGSAAVGGSFSLDEWLNADSFLEGERPPGNVTLSEMVRYVERHHGPLDGFSERLDEVVHDVFMAVAQQAEAERVELGRSFAYPGFDFIVERGGESGYELRLLELNSHPGLGWEGPISAALISTYRCWFDELFALVLAT